MVNTVQMDEIILVSKVDAATRQLETAIHLFFAYGDPVSVHTLVEAAYEIFRVMCESKKMFYVIRNNDYIRKDKQKEYHDLINEPKNYFKHASFKKKEPLRFNTAITSHFMVDASSMCVRLRGNASPIIQLFIFWYYCKYPDMIKDGLVRIGTNPLRAEQVSRIVEHLLDPNKREVFLELLPEISKASLPGFMPLSLDLRPS